MMLDFSRNELRTLSLDIHGMSCAEAKSFLVQKLDSAEKNVREVEVIHGYRGGTALKNMVRGLKHPRVEKCILSLNQGSTTLLLK